MNWRILSMEIWRFTVVTDVSETAEYVLRETSRVYWRIQDSNWLFEILRRERQENWLIWPAGVLKYLTRCQGSSNFVPFLWKDFVFNDLPIFKPVELKQELSEGNWMKINLHIFYNALHDPAKFQKNQVTRSQAIIFQSWVKIHRLLWQHVEFDSVLV